jgi:hypothetical protein
MQLPIEKVLEKAAVDFSTKVVCITFKVNAVGIKTNR